MLAAAPAEATNYRPHGDRDLRVDFFRGLALIFIFVNHVPGNVLGRFTLRNYALSDAADMFVLIAGYASVLAYGRLIERGGFSAVCRAVFGRMRQLYVAHLLLVLLGAGGMALAAWRFENPAYFEHLNLTPFSYDPFGAIWKLFVLYHQIGYLNILPLYIVLLAWFVVLLALARISLMLALGVSFTLWLIVQMTGVNMPAFPDNYGWYFNPFAWQLLFAMGFGAAMAARRGFSMPRAPWLIAVAAAYAALCLVIMAPWTMIPGLAGTRIVPFDLIGYPSKTNLSFHRLASILALAYLVVVLVPATAEWLKTRPAQWVIDCGRNALDIFCLGTLLSFAGFIVLLECGHDWIFQILVNAVGLGTLGGVAWWLSRRKVRLAPPKVAPATPERARAA